jgi:Icc-related predicted phosphoesterase
LLRSTRGDRRLRSLARFPSPPRGNVDLLLSHEPPHGVLDVALTDRRAKKDALVRSGTERNHAGSKILRDALDVLDDSVAPRVHVFGHIHEGHGAYTTNTTLFVNAANANPGRASHLVNGCMVIDVPLDADAAVAVTRGEAPLPPPSATRLRR